MPRLSSSIGRMLTIGEQSYLHFSGTSYLGIANHPAFQDWIIEGLRLYGNNFGGSRLSNLQFSIFEEAEACLAAQIGVGAALTVSSGTVAGQLAVRLLSDYQLEYAPTTHPALWQGRMPSSATTYEVWAKAMLNKAHTSKQPLCFVCNAIDPLYAQIYDFSWLRDLPKNGTYCLLADDSHSIGVLNAGRGILPNIPVIDQLEILVVASLGKAFGVPAGVLLGSQSRIEQATQNPFFAGASPSLPAYLHAFMAAQTLYTQQRQQLQTNINTFQKIAKTTTHFRSIPNHPVFYTSQNALYAQLFAQQIVISSFAYPFPDSAPITRIVLSAAHTTADIEALVFGLSNV